MKPEDIDDLFKGKLEGHTSGLPLPLWNRLEERMQQQQAKPEHSVDALFNSKLQNHETPLPANLWNRLEARMNPEEKKTRPMLMWYAAACIALLLSVGGFWKLQNGPDNQLATLEKALPETQNTTKTEITESNETDNRIQNPATENQTSALAEANLGTTASKSSEKFSPEKVTARTNSEITGSATTNAAGAKNKVVTDQKMPAAAPKAALEETLLAANVPAEPKKVATATENNNLPTLQNTPAKPLDVEIILASAAPVSQPETVDAGDDEQSDVKAKALFAKKVAKQLWSIKKGEKPDLNELGLAQNYTSEVKTRLQSLSKTINL